MKPTLAELLSEAYALATARLPRSLAEEKYLEQSRDWLAEGVEVSTLANQLAHQGDLARAQAVCDAYNAKKPRKPGGRPRNTLSNKTVEIAVARAALPETIQLITGDRRKKILEAAVKEIVARHGR